MPAVYEPALMSSGMPFGEVMRMTLMGSHERISTARVETIGLVTQVVPADELASVARRAATIIASQPAAAVQASLRTVWVSRDLPTSQVTELGNMFLNLSSSAASLKGSDNAVHQSKSRAINRPLRRTGGTRQDPRAHHVPP
jgi:enoyl-CoA hydratase/carnithine racemase